jgi:hypothetical protein
LRLFPKMKPALKGRIFQDIENIQEMWWNWKVFHNRSSRNVSNSGNIVGLIAQLLKGGTSMVTPPSKLYVYRYEAWSKIIPVTS